MINDFFELNNPAAFQNVANSKIIKKAQAIIVNDGIDPFVYNEKPYHVSTQNQRYLQAVLPDNLQNACIILGAGDTLFELLRRGILDITAIEINELQALVYKLRRACILTLSPREFDKFIVDPSGRHFLDKELFKTILTGFGNDKEAINFWKILLTINPSIDIKEHFFKPTDSYNISGVRYSLQYLKNKSYYYELRNYLMQAKIKIIIDDAFNYFAKNKDIHFDYIDFNNILLFVYQADCRWNIELFKAKIKALQEIYNNNLNEGGTLTLDYQFGMVKSHVENILRQSIPANSPADIIYSQLYELLNNAFMLESYQVERIIKSGDNPMDTVYFSRKLK